MAPMKPLLAITMGDPTGVGPETIAGAWSHESVHAACRAVVVGHAEVMRRAVQVMRQAVQVIEITSVGEVASGPHAMPCLTCCQENVLALPPAQADARGGAAAYDAVAVACRMALAGEVDGMVTAPLNKAALSAAGHAFPGHTELLASLCGVDDVAMMLYLAPGHAVRGRVGLGVAHATLHVGMRTAIELLTSERIVTTARLAHQVTRGLLGAIADTEPPRIAVCALNPHAGEESLFGSEEERIIRPAVRRGIAEGLALTGPLPADSLMARAVAGEFDAVVAMYHDQGHIALKLIAMYQSVNITLGLPVIRTSVAHGTAFDLAWKGQARSDAMVEAVRVAASLVRCHDRLTWK
jgi:4-hydroxythreonine-4-phosphate dehydrogenase